MRRRSGNGWADMQFVRVRSGGAWVDAWVAYTPMSGYLSPNPATASGPGLQTVYITAYISNGVPPYSYSWQLQQTGAGGSGTGNIQSGQGGPSITVTGNANRQSGGYWNGNAVLTVTDQTGRQFQVSGQIGFSIQKQSGPET